MHFLHSKPGAEWVRGHDIDNKVSQPFDNRFLDQFHKRTIPWRRFGIEQDRPRIQLKLFRFQSHGCNKGRRVGGYCPGYCMIMHERSGTSVASEQHSPAEERRLGTNLGHRIERKKLWKYRYAGLTSAISEFFYLVIGRVKNSLTMKKGMMYETSN